MFRKTALKEVPVGTTFEVWNRKYTVLDKGRYKIFVLAAEIETEMQFRENDEVYAVAPNDFRDCTIRNWLNDDYLGVLLRDGLKNGDILDLEVDLKCTLEQHEYGTDTVKAGLLTLEQYGTYFDIIPSIESSWWLATPWKTPSRSPNTYNTNDVWSVGSDGDCNRWFYNDAVGVRPALNLSPSLLVTWENKNYTENSDDWDSYIKYLHKWAVEHSDKGFNGCRPYAMTSGWAAKEVRIENEQCDVKHTAEMVQPDIDRSQDAGSTKNETCRS